MEPNARGRTSTLAIRRRAVPTAHRLLADEKLTPRPVYVRRSGLAYPRRECDHAGGAFHVERVPAAGADPRGRTPPADAHRAPHTALTRTAHRTQRGRTPHTARPHTARRPYDRGLRRCHAVHPAPGVAPDAQVRRGADCAASSPAPPPHSRRRATRATRHATSCHPGTVSGSTTCDPERDPPRLAAPARRRSARQATAGPDAQPQRRGTRRVRRRGSEDVDRPAHDGPGPSPSSPVSPRARHRLHECIPVRSFAGGRSTREGGRPESVSRERVGQVSAESDRPHALRQDRSRAVRATAASRRGPRSHRPIARPHTDLDLPSAAAGRGTN